MTLESSGHGCERHGIVGITLNTGTEKVLQHAGGTRYYSADGRTMLDLGRFRLVDTTGPLNPVELGQPPKAPDGIFITGAVSVDGSLVAIEMLEPEDNPRHNLMRVVVFDRSLRQRVVLLRRTTILGLQFEGRYLFVGVQRHPLPTYFEFDPTSQIVLFDLSSL